MDGYVRGVNTNYGRGDLNLLRALQWIVPTPKEYHHQNSDDYSVIITDGEVSYSSRSIINRCVLYRLRLRICNQQYKKNVFANQTDWCHMLLHLSQVSKQYMQIHG